MASGLAVLGFDSPGVRDLVEHEKTGLLADPKLDYLDENKAASFISQLKYLIENSDIRKSFSEAAFNSAQLRSWDSILAGLVHEYEILIDAVNKKLINS